MKRIYTSHETKLKVAHDYYFTDFSDKEIGIRHGTGTKTVHHHISGIPREALITESKKLLIKVLPEEYERAMMVLKRNMINTYEIAPSFELLEYYESSIK